MRWISVACAFACALLMMGAPAAAQLIPAKPNAPAGFVPTEACSWTDATGAQNLCSNITPMPTWSGYSSATALPVAGAARAAGRALMATCTAAGTATVTLADGSTASVAFSTGTSQPLPLSVTGIASSTATCSYYSLASVALATTGVAPVAGGTLDFSDPNQSALIL